MEQVYENTTRQHEANKAKVFPVHARRHLGGEELWVLLWLTSVLDEFQWLTSHIGRFILRNQRR
jgi:hypothetical protein